MVVKFLIGDLQLQMKVKREKTKPKDNWKWLIHRQQFLEEGFLKEEIRYESCDLMPLSSWVLISRFLYVKLMGWSSHLVALSCHSFSDGKSLLPARSVVGKVDSWSTEKSTLYNSTYGHTWEPWTVNHLLILNSEQVNKQ